MIKKLTCASALAAALLATAASAAGAADTARSPVPAAGAPGVPLLSDLLGSLEAGNPVTSLNTLLPMGVLGR
ncbi:hypothetical protein QWJ26_12395 [Streptomyces sp. CSDS2]|uniref:hypothetical protein n=1 Tax=Streptomyces sp. CSDS2 TaxID=3055051 RepID=UPI0025AF3434|nr:hypothetical protein [Streptomyces sp. CSDS2]MDN3260599.1 hypothetical protein [Streptomyces sp. CSDS2]